MRTVFTLLFFVLVGVSAAHGMWFVSVAAAVMASHLTRTAGEVSECAFYENVLRDVHSYYRRRLGNSE